MCNSGKSDRLIPLQFHELFAKLYSHTKDFKNAADKDKQAMPRPVTAGKNILI